MVGRGNKISNIRTLIQGLALEITVIMGRQGIGGCCLRGGGTAPLPRRYYLVIKWQSDVGGTSVGHSGKFSHRARDTGAVGLCASPLSTAIHKRQPLPLPSRRRLSRKTNITDFFLFHTFLWPFNQLCCRGEERWLRGRAVYSGHRQGKSVWQT